MASPKKRSNPRASKTNNQKKQQTIAKRIAKQKAAVLEMLETVPVVQIACKKSGISKATYYRWYRDDAEFAEVADAAKAEGTRTINELAQSKLIELISQGNLSASIFWLKCRNPEFVERRHVVNEVRRTPAVTKVEEGAINGVFELFEEVARRTVPRAVNSPDNSKKDLVNENEIIFPGQEKDDNTKQKGASD